MTIPTPIITKTTMKQHDTAPALDIVCFDPPSVEHPLGLLADLTAATSIRILCKQDGALLIDRTVTGTDEGVVVLVWEDGDTDVVADIIGEVEVTWGNGTIQTFPVGGYFTVKVKPDLG